MNDATLTDADLPDIQGLVTNGYGKLICSRFVFLRIQQPEQASAWLGRLLPHITTSERRLPNSPRPTFAMNIAFTYAGVQTLGLPNDPLTMFPREFQEGMASGERPRVLGDTGDSDPSLWDMGGPEPHNAPFHLLLLCYAVNDAVLNAKYAEWKADFEPGGVEPVYEQDTGRISEKEPFGFRDGVSQPLLEGSPGKFTPGETPIHAGEFLLSYRNGYDTITPAPLISQDMDPNNVLPPSVLAPASKDFGRNGSFLIFRKLGQDVKGFWEYLDAQTKLLGMESTKANVEWLGAKVVGRWKSGAPLVQAPTQDDPALATSNDFEFMQTDPDVLACPIGAHIRRANPCDSLQPNPGKSRIISNRHRLIRRGRHYEDHRKPGETWEASGIEHGLCFIALNADIQRQFEFLQQTWLLSEKFNGLYDEKDVLLGDNDGSGRMSLPGESVRQRLCGVPRFVRVRGGGYFFLPGMRALRFLAAP